MTRERAKELAPIIAAYGEGKKVQYYDECDGVWCTVIDPVWGNNGPYRIAPEPRKRAMTRDEVLNFLAERPNILVMIDDVGEWYLSEYFAYENPAAYSYCLVTNGVRSEPRKFEIEEDSDE